MSIRKTIITTVVALTLVAMVAPGVAQGLTIDDLMAQIAQLQAQLLALQGGSGATPVPTGVVACSGVTFTRTLVIGSTGQDVKCLQVLLNTNGYTLAQSGAGSPGMETSYFGPITLRAVRAFQVAKGWTPANQVGPLTRAALNALIGSTPGTPGTPGTPATPAGAVTVSLAYDNPASATVVSDTTSSNGAQALAPMIKLSFSTASGTATTVTTLRLKRSGISTDSDLSNLYLYDGSTRLAELVSAGSGYYTFSNPAGLFTVNGTKTITVKADIANGTTAGKTIGLSVNASTDVVSNSSVTGIFPLNGNLMATASVDNLGKLTVAEQSNPGASIEVANDVVLWEMKLTAATQKIKVNQIKLNVIGTISATDLANLYLTDGVSNIGSVVPFLSSDKTVTFDLSSSPYYITAGNIKYVSVRGDIVGGSGRTFYFSIRSADDIVAMDDNYGVYLKVNQGDSFAVVPASATETTITGGTLQVTKTADSPSGNIAQGALNVAFGKFTIKALGEAIKVSSLTLTTTGNASLSTLDVDNAKILLDGVQVGISKDLDTNGVTPTDTEFTFGNQFIVNAGATRTLEIYADVKTGAGADFTALTTIQVDLKTGNGNAIKMTSGAAYNTPSATSNNLTVSAAALSTTKNASVANIATIASANDVTIGSWMITAGAAEGARITSVRIVDRAAGDGGNGSQGIGSAFDTLKLMSNGVQYGQTISSPSSAAGTAQTFSIGGSALNIPAGQSIQINLVANVKGSAAWTATDAIKINQVVGVGLVSSGTITDSTGGIGQQLSLGTPTLTVVQEASPTLPASTLLVAGKTGLTVGAWKVSANNVEALKVVRIKVSEVDSADKSGAVRNLSLWVGGSQVGSTIPALTSRTATFENPAGLFTVPKGGNVSLVLKADTTDAVNAFTGQSGATNGLTIQFRVSNVATQTSTTDISAVGSTSGVFATGAASANYDANVMKVVTTKPTFTCVSGSAGCDSAQKTLVPGNVEVLRFNVAADSADDVKLTAANVNNLRFTIVSSITGTAQTFSLYDAATNTKVATDVTATPSNGATVDFATGLDITVPAGTTKTYYVRASLSDYTATGASFQLTMQNAAADLSWNDNSGVISGATVDISDTYTGKGLPLEGGIFVKPGV